MSILFQEAYKSLDKFLEYLVDIESYGEVEEILINHKERLSIAKLIELSRQVSEWGARNGY